MLSISTRILSIVIRDARHTINQQTDLFRENTQWVTLGDSTPRFTNILIYY